MDISKSDCCIKIFEYLCPQVFGLPKLFLSFSDKKSAVFHVVNNAKLVSCNFFLSFKNLFLSIPAPNRMEILFDFFNNL